MHSPLSVISVGNRLIRQFGAVEGGGVGIGGIDEAGDEGVAVSPICSPKTSIFYTI